MDSKKVFIVDGSGYIFRAYYGVGRLTAKDGFPTNALYGFVRMLGRLLQDSAASHIIVVFDAGRKTFRNDLYPEYKANRSECPEDLVPQMPFFREITTALGLQVLESPGYEADDIIGTLVQRYEETGCEIVIVSGDKDLSQLVDSRVSIWDTMKDKRFGAEGVIEKFGVPPEKVVEVLALMGDTSDNIPGVQGIGPKTATQLIQKFETAEGVIANIEAIRNDASIRGRAKVADTLTQSIDVLRLSRKLVEILRTAPFEVAVDGKRVPVTELDAQTLYDAAARREANSEHLAELFTRFEFTSLLKEMNLSVKPKKSEPHGEYKTIYADAFDDFVRTLADQKRFAFDLETTSLDIFAAEIVGISFCWNEKEAYYIPVAHAICPDGKRQVSKEKLFTALAPILTSPEYKKVGQNIKYDMNVLGAQGVEVDGIWFDTMIAAYLLHPDKGGYNMTALAQEYLGKGVIEYEDLTGVADGFAHVSIEDATNYSAEDAHITWLLMEVLSVKLAEQEIERVMYDIEMPLVPVISRMERAGVKLDTKLLAAMSEEFGVELNEIRGRLIGLAGMDFNLNSPKQLADIMFGKLGISTKGVKKTKTGFSTDSSVLELLSQTHDFPKEVLRYRMLFKLKSTYIDSLPNEINPKTHRLHSRFNQTVAATGRLSSSDPNLQNIPIQSKEGRRIRAAFVGEPGTVIVSADYSQIELRVLAHMSGDAGLIQAFNDEIDIHSKTAREIFRLNEKDPVPSDMRRIGKTLNFGIIYGMSGFRLSKELGISVREGDAYIEQYFSRYPRVRELFASLERDAQEKGHVTTAFGRKRFIAEANVNERDRGFQNRIAVNAPLQGTAADIVKLAMIKLDERIIEEKLPVKMIMQVHDELVFETPASSKDSTIAIVRKEMEGVCSLLVPLKVDVGVGPNWEEAH